MFDVVMPKSIFDVALVQFGITDLSFDPVRVFCVVSWFLLKI